jgi:hypothetical protein
MLGISKSMVCAAALVSFGLVNLGDAAKGSNARAPAAVPAERAAATPGPATSRGEKVRFKAEPSSPCRQQVWPYYSSECLVPGTDGKQPPAVRIISLGPAADHPVLPARH